MLAVGPMMDKRIEQLNAVAGSPGHAVLVERLDEFRVVFVVFVD
jgi:hypothetical protein